MSSDLPNARVDGSISKPMISKPMISKPMISKPMISMAVTPNAFASPFSAKATGQ